MVCENFSKNYPIAIKFSGYIPLFESTSAIDFGPGRSIRLAGRGSKVGHNDLYCAYVCK